MRLSKVKQSQFDSSAYHSINFTMVLSVLAVVIFIIQNNPDYFYRIGVTGLFVPDAISLRDALDTYWYRDLKDNSWEEWRTIIGVMLIYQPGAIFGWFGFAVVNLSLLTISIVIFRKTIRDVGISFRTFPEMLLVLGNFYLIEVLLYPNKEIPLLAITSLFSWFLMVKKSFLGVLLSIVLAFMFRDGYGIILFIAALFVYFSKNLSGRAVLFCFFLIMLAFSTLSMELFQDVDYSLKRNISLGSYIESHYDDLISGQFGYFFRLIGNALNLATRPQFLDCDQNLYLLNVGFWQFGVLLIAGTLWALKNLFQNNTNSKGVASLVLFTLLGVSYSSFVQPRYLMPLIYFYSIAFTIDRRCALIALFIGIAGSIFFFSIGQLPQCATGVLDGMY